MINFSNIPDAEALTGFEFVLMEQGGGVVKAPLYDVINTPAGTYAATPTSFVATAFDSYQIDLTWSGTADEFVLESCRDNNEAWQEIYRGATAAYSNELLYPEETYYYRVKAQVATQWDSEWATTNETTPALP